MLNKTLYTSKKFYLLLITFITLSLLWPVLPLQDNPTYFDFADKRFWLGLQNTADVLSNIPFMLAGLYGFWVIAKNKNLPRSYKHALLILSVGAFLTCFGSMHFHLNPNEGTLYWDRMPMTIGFSGVVSLVILDRLNQKKGQLISSLLIAWGFLSVTGWHLHWFTLRPYLLLQYGCIIFTLLTILFTKSHLVNNRSMLIALGFYVFAKVTEKLDLAIYEKGQYIISGHTLKHLLAAVAIFLIFRIFQRKKLPNT